MSGEEQQSSRRRTNSSTPPPTPATLQETRQVLPGTLSLHLPSLYYGLNPQHTGHSSVTENMIAQGLNQSITRQLAIREPNILPLHHNVTLPGFGNDNSLQHAAATSRVLPTSQDRLVPLGAALSALRERTHRSSPGAEGETKVGSRLSRSERSVTNQTPPASGQQQQLFSYPSIGLLPSLSSFQRPNPYGSLSMPGAHLDALLLHHNASRLRSPLETDRLAAVSFAPTQGNHSPFSIAYAAALADLVERGAVMTSRSSLVPDVLTTQVLRQNEPTSNIEPAHRVPSNDPSKASERHDDEAQSPPKKRKRRRRHLPDPNRERKITLTNRPPIALALEADKDVLSPYQVLIRQQIELFETTETQVGGKAQGRNTPVVPGQVGIQCKHCSGIAVEDRSSGAVFYSQSLVGVYQIAQNMAKTHWLSGKCDNIPTEIRARLGELQQSLKRGSGGKGYWTAAVQKLGVYEDDNILKFTPLPPEENKKG